VEVSPGDGNAAEGDAVGGKEGPAGGGVNSAP